MKLSGRPYFDSLDGAYPLETIVNTIVIYYVLMRGNLVAPQDIIDSIDASLSFLGDRKSKNLIYNDYRQLLKGKVSQNDTDERKEFVATTVYVEAIRKKVDEIVLPGCPIDEHGYEFSGIAISGNSKTFDKYLDELGEDSVGNFTSIVNLTLNAIQYLSKRDSIDVKDVFFSAVENIDGLLSELEELREYVFRAYRIILLNLVVDSGSIRIGADKSEGYLSTVLEDMNIVMSRFHFTVDLIQVSQERIKLIASNASKEIAKVSNAKIYIADLKAKYEEDFKYLYGDSFSDQNSIESIEENYVDWVLGIDIVAQGLPSEDLFLAVIESPFEVCFFDYVSSYSELEKAVSMNDVLFWAKQVLGYEDDVRAYVERLLDYDTNLTSLRRYIALTKLSENLDRMMLAANNNFFNEALKDCYQVVDSGVLNGFSDSLYIAEAQMVSDEVNLVDLFDIDNALVLGSGELTGLVEILGGDFVTVLDLLEDQVLTYDIGDLESIVKFLRRSDDLGLIRKCLEEFLNIWPQEMISDLSVRIDSDSVRAVLLELTSSEVKSGVNFFISPNKPISANDLNKFFDSLGARKINSKGSHVKYRVCLKNLEHDFIVSNSLLKDGKFFPSFLLRHLSRRFTNGLSLDSQDISLLRRAFERVGLELKQNLQR